MKEFHGGCHCGDITYVLRWPSDERPLLRKCSCSFCARHGAAYTAHAEAALSVTVSHSRALGQYEFATRTASFRFCLRCGILVFVTSLIDGREHAVININTLNDFVPFSDAAVRSFEGETIQERLIRRRRSWIRDVTVTIASA